MCFYNFYRAKSFTCPEKSVWLNTNSSHLPDWFWNTVSNSVVKWQCSNLQSCEKYKILYYFHCFFNPLLYLNLIQWLPTIVLRHVSMSLPCPQHFYSDFKKLKLKKFKVKNAVVWRRKGKLVCLYGHLCQGHLHQGQIFEERSKLFFCLMDSRDQTTMAFNLR